MTLAQVAVFASAFFLAAFAGVAALLRSGTSVCRKTVASSFLNSGMLGLSISLIYFYYFKDNLFTLIGICLLAGLGGMTAVDFVLQLAGQKGLQIKFETKDKPNEPPK